MTSCEVQVLSHSTVQGVARFGSNVAERLSPLREELSVCMVIFSAEKDRELLIAQKNVDRFSPKEISWQSCSWMR